MNNQKGTRRTVWLPAELEAKAEEVRRALGLGRSGFYRYAVTKIVERARYSLEKPGRGRTTRLCLSRSLSGGEEHS
jgi:hypothetical protein